MADFTFKTYGSISPKDVDKTYLLVFFYPAWRGDESVSDYSQVKGTSLKRNRAHWKCSFAAMKK